MAIPKSKLFSILIAVLSLVGMILLLAEDFGGFWWTGYGAGERFSCLGCAYTTPLGGDVVAMIVGAILLAVQLVIAVNALLPKPFLKKLPFEKHLIPIMGIATIIMMVIGGIAFGSYYTNYEWWFGAGFYGGLIAGILNTLLAVLSLRMKR